MTMSMCVMTMVIMTLTLDSDDNYDDEDQPLLRAVYQRGFSRVAVASEAGSLPSKMSKLKVLCFKGTAMTIREL